MLFRKKSKEKYITEVNSFIDDCEKSGITPDNYTAEDLSLENFPNELTELYSFAEKFGQACDRLRPYIVLKTPIKELNELVSIFEINHEQWESWLTEIEQPSKNEEFALYYLRDAYLHAKEHMKKMSTYK